MFMGTEWSQSQASLRTPWRFWKTQFCPGCILSKQIFSLSVPALRISYATESLLEQSPSMHWYGTACQHPDARTVSCWPVLKSKWGEKKSISDNGTVMLDSLAWSIFFYLFVLVMGTGHDVFQGDTRTSTHLLLFVLQQLLMVEAESACLTDISRLVLGRSFCFIFTLALIYGNSKPLESLNNRIGLGEPLASHSSYSLIELLLEVSSCVYVSHDSSSQFPSHLLTEGEGWYRTIKKPH